MDLTLQGNVNLCHFTFIGIVHCTTEMVVVFRDVICPSLQSNTIGRMLCRFLPTSWFG